MRIKLTGEFSLFVDDKSGLCGLSTLFDYGNAIRKVAGKNQISLECFLGYDKTNTFISSVESLFYGNTRPSEANTANGRYFRVVGPLNCVIPGVDSTEKTLGDIIMTLRVAHELDENLERLIFAEFLKENNGYIPHMRLKQAIKDNIPIMNDNLQWGFENISKAIQKRILGDKYAHLTVMIQGQEVKERNDWDYANKKELEQRDTLYSKLLTAIEVQPGISETRLLELVITFKV